mgnify:FL=1
MQACWKVSHKKAEPNVYSKFSALGTFIHRNDPELIDGIVAETIDIFGTDRRLFGSNISIEKLWSDTTSVVQVDRDTAVKISTREKADIFWNTEPSVYKLQDSPNPIKQDFGSA